MTPDFQFLLSKLGRPTKTRPFPAEADEAYRGRLPDSLLDFLSEVGVCTLAKGKFQFCVPSDYASLAKAVLGNDPQFDAARTHIIGFTAFGELYMWHEEYRRLRIRLTDLVAFAGYVRPSPLDPERQIPTWLLALRFDASDVGEEGTAEPLFARAAKKLGELSLGEIYGFVPALGLGGAPRLDNIQRVNALVHMTILAGLGRPRIIHYGDDRVEFIREIG